ncbi:MAG: NAD(P)H-dependent oxidoreductase subunit E [Candidatus Thorarchaeota archaeon]
MQDLSRADLAEQVIPSLQEIQERLGYIPREAITWLADKLRLSEQEIYGVASFYNNFRFTPPGKHHLRICLGTACHVQGGDRLLAATSEKLGIKPGDTTPDRRYSLERVACVGCCALAPAVVLDDEVHGRTTQRSLKRLLDTVDREDRKAEKSKGGSQ